MNYRELKKDLIGIYKITSPSGKIYIGQSMCIKSRWASYRVLNCKGQPKLYRSLNKYGVKSHVFEVIEECEITELNEREYYWQIEYNSVSRKGLNCVMTNPLTKVKEHSEETKNKISRGNHHSAQKVIDTSNGLIYNCISDCADAIGIKKSNLNHMLRGRSKNKTTIKYLDESLNVKREYKKQKRYNTNRKRKKIVEVKTQRNNNIILDTFTGVFYYGFCDFIRHLNIEYRKDFKNTERFIKRRINNKDKYKEFERYILT